MTPDSAAAGARTSVPIGRAPSTATTGAAATAAVPEFDLGPLTWVEREIDQALARGAESLVAFCKAEKDVTALKDARAHVHQAAGAIRMVGLDAVAEFTDEIERNLVHVEGLAGPKREAAGAVIERACQRLSIFLREISGGAPLATVKLYPEYLAMHRSRGINAVSPSNLFYPELRTRPPKVALHEVVPANKLPSHLAKKRRLYQSGLLSWLRGDVQGSKAMCEAVAGIEAVTERDGLRSFWWTVRALLEALTERGLETSPEVKHLASLIDLQIRRVVEGSAEAAHRLRREVLYYVAVSAPVSPTVRAVQRAFRLPGLVPPTDSINTDVVSTEPLVREARDQLAAVKETWVSFALGRTENLAKLKQALTLVHAKATELRHGALTELAAALLERLNSMPAGAISESLAMEFTTALILVETAFEHYASLPVEFSQQIETMIERLEAAAAGRPTPGDAAMLGNLGKRAQERMLLGQVGQEIRANLRRIEEVLDTFFRDVTKRSELTSLAKDSGQIHGALRILGFDRADRLLALCDERIQGYARPETEVSTEELELLAESLCCLGFYFEEVEQQRPNSERILAPLLARWLGEPLQFPVEEPESVESAVAALRAELPRLVEAAHRDANDANGLEELKCKLARLRSDAELIGDEDLARQADTAIAELELGSEALVAAVQAIAEPPAAVPQVSEETRRLLGVGATALDAGLLDVYLTEAAKVLTAISSGHDALVRNASDREALHAVRRGFHTLKESGRMVGLSELAALASEVEMVHNRLIAEERAVTAAVVAMIETAHASFSFWVNAVRRMGHVQPDPAKLREAIRNVDDELSTGTQAAAKDIQRAALVHSASIETLEGVHDEIDRELLARFLDEAAALYRAAGEQFRAWSSAPQDQTAADQLYRTLHAFKGGARMAGAMRLGQLTQVMESRLLAGKRSAATPELLAELGTDLELIAYMLDKLRAGESNIALPPLGAQAVAHSSRAIPESVHVPPEAFAEQPIIVSRVAPSAHDDAMQEAHDKAAEASIGRASSTNDVSVLKANLLEFANRMTAMRSRVREIEVQTDIQIRLRVTDLHDNDGGSDFNAPDTLTNVQDLARSLAEALDGLASIQQALQRNLEDADCC